MAYITTDGVRVWGQPEESAVAQAKTCARHGRVVQALLMADHHKGYSQPIGGVIVYDGQISPSGVGYDIACGNKAVRTNLYAADIQPRIGVIMDEIAGKISFGVGRNNKEPVDNELFDDPDWAVYQAIGRHEHDTLKALARNQLGTVGSGNHYVDLFVEPESGRLWIGNHFGSRGFGHKTASGFLNLAAGQEFLGKAPGESMDQPPVLLELDSELGDMYYRAMKLAGRYAYAGREYVISQVLSILGAEADFEVHNHHNFAWQERHNGRDTIVVRKGATPSAPGQLGFIGGSMGDISVIVRGTDSEENRDAYYSTVHGAGRMMSRTQAAGRMNWKTRTRTGGQITPKQMQEAVRSFGVELRGAGTDESPFVYRKLQAVLDAHQNTLDVLHVLKPIGVCMAGANEFDPYKD
ncbi:RtcB family protein [Paenibacillus thiaminolyticus]|uniref:3'-phosphate/5'-hydroxy nucleic acid ligase n=1 Tax=Paenibacillus thiaminolyticus TaxID=49283 RepID=A0AAP9DX98_PANTH|nr:RtcB family protein [Paenibacillus thiaminolyticus]MCY9536673.1 RtcB family protein [Paenibacillus thiaminolyticus]MCY9601966.1 RtcB family protein [Paenibacillus thiaminolyticus]MCY9609849.1 RtcB family protein [Paenibacillus thiaminolyticus]MCY9613793.1 RtcB family protein [Paenibacillus thiaminolyticus]MCY9620695.1 RtcB family protein [Paenibacillus thiaminolyticus]